MDFKEIQTNIIWKIGQTGKSSVQQYGQSTNAKVEYILQNEKWKKMKILNKRIVLIFCC